MRQFNRRFCYWLLSAVALGAGCTSANINNTGTSGGTPPVPTPGAIKAVVTPAPNASGWNNTDVTVSFQCTGTISACPASRIVSAEGSGQVVQASVTDGTGQTVTASVTLNIDKTRPTVTASPAPLPNASGWNNSNVTVTFSCTDSLSGVVSCPEASVVNMDGANQSVSGAVTDVAGNVALTTIKVNLDKTPPGLTAIPSQTPNAKGWNNAAVTVSFTCSDPTSGIVSCPAPQFVVSEGTGQVITANVTDNAGNSATTSVTINLDQTPPNVSIQSPQSGQSIDLTASSITVAGSESDSLSGTTSVTCNGQTAAITGSSFTCVSSMTAGSNTISVQALDVAGNSVTVPINLSYAPAPSLTITSPSNLSVTNVSPVTVNGTLSDLNATVTINGVAALQGSGAFSIPIPLVEGLNTLAAVATGPNGAKSTATVQITLDTTPPHIVIDSPADGSTTTDASVAVSGLANDVVVGTVNLQDVQVTVNGVSAQVANRTFSAATVQLALGPNIIQAAGQDRAGNGTTTSITVTRLPQGQSQSTLIGTPILTQSLNVVSGNNQSVTIGTLLPQPLVVALTDSAGKPVPNQPVIFRVTGNDGLVTSAGGSIPGSSVVTNTDASGRAQGLWTLGQRAGAGINTVRVSSVYATSSASFSAQGLTSTPAQIVVDSGNGQLGAIGQALPFPFVATVVDSGHNRVANVPVTFTVAEGGGTIAGRTSQTITTDSNGRALAVLTLGLQEGNENNLVVAGVTGANLLSAAFSASGRAPGDPAATTISGSVLDNSNVPIPGVTMRLFQTNQGNVNNLPIQIGTPVQTDSHGTFQIASAPVGSFKLMADGTTAATTQTYPTLEYDVVTIAGNDNTVGMPIYLPALDTVNKLCVDDTHGGTLTLPQVPGFSLTVLPGSATFPGGSRQGCISVTSVNGDKVPMTPGFGQQPQFIVTIQPVGTSFNPPAAMNLPNADGLAPRSVTEMYSYDHDLGMFVAIGTGTVSDDGSTIVSDPGVGVVKAGWHCGGNPNPTGSAGHCPDCQKCQTEDHEGYTVVSCVPDPSTKFNKCQDEEPYFFESVLNHPGIIVNVDSSCKGSCDGNGNCTGIAGNGFSIGQVHEALSGALAKIFDDSNDACIEPGLRQTLQRALDENGINVKCDANVFTTDCAHVDSVGSNSLTVNLKAMSDLHEECTGQGLSSTLLHEMIHGFGNNVGAPSLNFHNQTGTTGADCRDRVYGCEESCFPHSTDDYRNGTPGSKGNPGACRLDPGAYAAGDLPGCLPCRSVVMRDGKTVQMCPTDPTCEFGPAGVVCKTK